MSEQKAALPDLFARAIYTCDYNGDESERHGNNSEAEAWFDMRDMVKEIRDHLPPSETEKAAAQAPGVKPEGSAVTGHVPAPAAPVAVCEHGWLRDGCPVCAPAAPSPGMPEEPRNYHFVGSIASYENGRLVDEIEHGEFRSDLSEPVVLRRDYDARAASLQERLDAISTDKHDPKVDTSYTGQIASLRADRDRLREALAHIKWIKDGGVHATDEHGVFRNYPDVERDAMYQLAVAALAQKEESNADHS